MIEKVDVQKKLTINNKVSSGLNIPILNDKMIEETNFWIPPVLAWKPSKTKNSNIRMACVVEDRLYQGLRFEGDVMLLTPGNWKSILKYCKFDFLLMESTWVSSCGFESMGQCQGSPDQENLLQILNYARKKLIPTVYWMTKGHEYHDLYKDFSRHFDYVFCADPIEVEKMKAEGIPAEVLSPCIQPAIHNPFRHYDYYNTFSLNVLFDGWADLDRLQDEIKILKEIKKFGLSIIESRYRIFQNKVKLVPEYMDCILGCATRQSRISALKYAKVYTTFQHTLSTQTEQQWMTLEAGACRLAVVHTGELKDGDLRKDFVVECADSFELLIELTRLKKDDLYRERIAHKGWRAVHQRHTFSHRIKSICEKLDIENTWNELPKISVIIPTHRREKMKRCLDMFEQQTYFNRELIIVFNGNELLSLKDIGLNESVKNVKVMNIPSDLFAGACLNFGHLQATGEYYFRFDDDDYYGANYISDMILNTKSIDVELFGKSLAPLYVENDQVVCSRNFPLSFCIVPYSELERPDIWIDGDSISGHRHFFKNIQYDDLSFGAADSSLMYNLPSTDDGYFALMDGLNLVTERKLDPTTHTWKIENSKVEETEKNIDVEDFIV